MTETRMGKPLAYLLNFPKGARIAVVGCCGKSSAISSIAKEKEKELKILIAPTTSIWMPADEAFCFDSEEISKHFPQKGVQYAGLKSISNKLKALPLDVLEKVSRLYDITLMEADGSKGLPLKGWADYEPVIPEFTTHTLGVVLTNSLNLTVTETNVHRLKLFAMITGLKIGDHVTYDSLYKMIFAEGGMLTKARGDITLLLNGVKPAEHRSAIDFCNFIHRKAGNIQILIGDTYTDIWYKNG